MFGTAERGKHHEALPRGVVARECQHSSVLR
jgi:hypothetical protein